MAGSKVVMLSSPKGGSGKSTVAMNLARAMQLGGMDVILVDLDDSTHTATNWLKCWMSDHEPSQPPPLPPIMSMIGDVEAQIRKLARSHDVVVLDAGAGAPLQNQTAIKAADLLLIPVAPSPFDILPTMQYISEIHRVQMMFGRPEARVILNKLEANRTAAEDAIQLFSAPGVPVRPLQTLIPARQSLQKILAAGVTVFDYPRAADLRDVFTRLGSEVRTILGLEVAQSNSPAKA